MKNTEILPKLLQMLKPFKLCCIIVCLLRRTVTHQEADVQQLKSPTGPELRTRLQRWLDKLQTKRNSGLMRRHEIRTWSLQSACGSSVPSAVALGSKKSGCWSSWRYLQGVRMWVEPTGDKNPKIHIRSCDTYHHNKLVCSSPSSPNESLTESDTVKLFIINIYGPPAPQAEFLSEFPKVLSD